MVLNRGPLANVWSLFSLPSNGISWVQTRDAPIILHYTGQPLTAENLLRMSLVPRLRNFHLEEAGGGSDQFLTFLMHFLSLHWAYRVLSGPCVAFCVHLPSETSLGEEMEELVSGISQMGSMKGNRASIVRGCGWGWEAWNPRVLRYRFAKPR